MEAPASRLALVERGGRNTEAGIADRKVVLRLVCVNHIARIGGFGLLLNIYGKWRRDCDKQLERQDDRRRTNVILETSDHFFLPPKIDFRAKPKTVHPPRIPMTICKFNSGCCSPCYAGERKGGLESELKRIPGTSDNAHGDPSGRTSALPPQHPCRWRSDCSPCHASR